MVINPISVQGEITRAQDLSTIKHNEDNKGTMQQLTINKQQENEAETRARQVRRKDDPENQGKKYDAKEKGNNEYEGNGGKKQKKESPEQRDGKVILKKAVSNFDIKV
jgi:chromatin remodeling complex protein RSC6